MNKKHILREYGVVIVKSLTDGLDCPLVQVPAYFCFVTNAVKLKSKHRRVIHPTEQSWWLVTFGRRESCVQDAMRGPREEWSN
ncbi:hypothetical protein AVEN_209665-1 [Araneus ventricosus]|uniref:Uncharacterized protein n=1 Tax=Araneus ventricosus TaxID=182803 RepID=A0A4Y2D5L5_ARAVE|nr:hypothetical protein AVEN_209665-1 [Araneus ventricosus]